MGVTDDMGLVGKAAYQIGESLVFAPAGVFEVGRALGYDVTNVGRGDVSFKHSRETGKNIAKGVVESYRNPGENPGYILLDAFGLISAGAGAGARVSAASRAVGKGAKARALLTRPRPGVDELGGEQCSK
jgi:hypothetical protein